MKKNEKLKPCPICGKNAGYIYDDDGHRYASCKNCYAAASLRVWQLRSWKKNDKAKESDLSDLRKLVAKLDLKLCDLSKECIELRRERQQIWDAAQKHYYDINETSGKCYAFSDWEAAKK